MGQSSSSSRRRRYNEFDHQPFSSSSPLPHPPPPPPPADSRFPNLPPPPPPRPDGYVLAANPPYPPAGYSHPYPAPPPYHLYSPQSGGGYGGAVRFFGSLINRSGYAQPSYYGTHQGNHRWLSSSPASSSSAAWATITPPPYVEHDKATTVKNEVNLHKDSIRLEPDEHNPDQHLVSFTFDSLVDGSFTISYFAKEGADCSFTPLYPDMYMPITIPFEKGLGQKFSQPSGSGIDLGFFELDDLSKPSPHGDVFPLVIYAEASPTTLLADELVKGESTAAAGAQITLAVIETRNGGPFQVNVMKQILWVGGKRYELQEIFDLGMSAEAQFDGDDDPEKECVICMSEPRDTAVLPCRHMCMCSDCAKALRLHSNKCPICRQPVEKLMEIPNQRKKKGSNGDQDGMS